ncbi:MAG: inorganic diphosphatase [Ginsengibacter sp.]
MKLPNTFSKKGKHINAVIETPKGCEAKYDFDKETQMFKLKKILPRGMVFPFHFGFIPGTCAEDGDPVDVLVLMDQLSWPGCIIECDLIGVMEAEETKDGKTSRNDRLIATAKAADNYSHIKELDDMEEYLEKEIENFFNNYCNLEKKEFKVIAKKGPEKAMELIKKQITDGNDR